MPNTVTELTIVFFTFTPKTLKIIFAAIKGHFSLAGLSSLLYVSILLTKYKTN
jgi:hypothetical protein